MSMTIQRGAVAVLTAASLSLLGLPASATATAEPSAAHETSTREARVFGATAVRDSAEDQGAIIRTIPANSFLVMDSAASPDSAWLRVMVDGRVGFVPKKYAEGPWLGHRASGDTSVKPVPYELQQKIVNLNL